MHFGTIFLASIEGAIPRALKAEVEGFDSIWFPEFIVRRTRAAFGEHGEPLAMLSHVAALTKRVRLGTAVLGINRRNPAVLSQEFATLDRLSGGRTILGLGPGARRQELALGLEPKEPDYILEYVEVIRKFWSDDLVSHEGKYFKMDGVPSARPAHRIPIYIGGFSEGARRATAIAGDGWLANWIYTPEVFGELLSWIRDEARRVGRDPSSLVGGYLTGVCISEDIERGIAFARERAFGIMPKVQLQNYGEELLRMAGYDIGPVEDPSQIPEEFVERTFMLGDPDDIIGKIEEYVKAGVEEFILHFADEDSESAFVGRVIPYFGHQSADPL